MRIDFLRIPAILACFFSALMVPQVWAADIVVDTSLDSQAADGLCSLREAMLNAEGADQSGSVDCTAGSPVDNRILFEPFLIGSSIALTGGVLPAISRNIEIIGPVVGDPEGLEINAGGTSRIFEISQADAVRLVDLKLIKGQTSTPGQPGATIWIDNGSNVGLERVWIEGGAALEAGGGAIALFDSTLTIEFSFLEQNGAAGAGGAVFASNSNVQIDDSNFENNSAVGTGGGISLVGGQLTVNNSDFTLNSTRGNNGSGGALSVEGADLFLNHSQIAANFTEGQSAQGGGVHVFNGNLYMTGGSVQNNVGQGEFGSGGGVRVRNGSAFFSDGCEIRDNLTSQFSGYGGGIRLSGGDLTMNDCVVGGNRTQGDNAHGGGIYVIDGNATIENSQITDNSTEGASAQGGGLRVLNGNLDMIDSLVDSNATAGESAYGGGIYHRNGDAIIVNSVISNNETAGFTADGGGLYLFLSGINLSDSLIEGNRVLDDSRGAGVALLLGDYTIERVAIVGNQSNRAGAGVYVNESELVVVNSTLSGNVADSESGAALRVFRGNTELIHVTVADNVNLSSSLGEVSVGGIPPDPGILSLVNSLVVNNRCTSSINGTLYVTSSVSSDESCADSATLEAAIQLGPLADNGGLIPTHALGSGSVAINAGGNCVAGLGISVDQRGQTRPGGSLLACDVGAYEFQGSAPEADLALAVNVSPDTAAVDQEIIVAIELEQTGPDPASNIEVQIDWPADLNASSWESTAGTFDSSTGLWQITSLMPSEVPVLTMTMIPTLPGEREISASVSANQGDPNAGNNVATDTIEIIASDSIFNDRFRNFQ